MFGIKHYAGEVMYTVSGILEKNKDSVAEEMIELMKASRDPWVSRIFADKVEVEKPKPGRPMGGGSKTTAATYFKNQLTSLVNTLGETSPHYVRCISKLLHLADIFVEPNMQKKAFVFDEQQVISQLRYSGMLDTIKIRKAGFDVRITFEKFLEKYAIEF